MAFPTATRAEGGETVTPAIGLAAALALLGAACQQVPDVLASPYGVSTRPDLTWTQPAAPQPAPYHPPPLATLTPAPPATPVIGTNAASGSQGHAAPAPSYSSTSLLTPNPAPPSASLIGPQRADWKPGDGF